MNIIQFRKISILIHKISEVKTGLNKKQSKSVTSAYSKHTYIYPISNKRVSKI